MIDGIVFKCSVEDFRKDRLGECTIKFKVPFSDIAAAFQAGELTEEVLYVTVYRESDFVAMKRQQGGPHEVPMASVPSDKSQPTRARGRDLGAAPRRRSKGAGL